MNNHCQKSVVLESSGQFGPG